MGNAGAQHAAQHGYSPRIIRFYRGLLLQLNGGTSWESCKQNVYVSIRTLSPDMPWPSTYSCFSAACSCSGVLFRAMAANAGPACAAMWELTHAPQEDSSKRAAAVPNNFAWAAPSSPKLAPVFEQNTEGKGIHGKFNGFHSNLTFQPHCHLPIQDSGPKLHEDRIQKADGGQPICGFVQASRIGLVLPVLSFCDIFFPSPCKKGLSDERGACGPRRCRTRAEDRKIATQATRSKALQMRPQKSPPAPAVAGRKERPEKRHARLKKRQAGLKRRLKRGWKHDNRLKRRQGRRVGKNHPGLKKRLGPEGSVAWKMTFWLATWKFTVVL